MRIPQLRVERLVCRCATVLTEVVINALPFECPVCGHDLTERALNERAVLEGAFVIVEEGR